MSSTRNRSAVTVGQTRGPDDRVWPDLPVGQPPSTPKRVCIVSPDIWGPVRNGGIGTLFRNLAFALVDHGHDVTLLFTQGVHSEDRDIDHWVDWYASKGVTFVPLPIAEARLSSGPLTMSGRVSYRVLEYFKTAPAFDVVHAPEFAGVLYYSLLAKKCGLAFDSTTFVVGTHSCGWWNFEGNVEVPREYSDLLRIHRELSTVEHADVVISSSQHMARWLSDHDVPLPDDTFVWPNAVGEVPEIVPASGNLGGLAFSGRFEARKGLHLFLATMRLLPREILELGPIHFLGKRVERFDIDGALAAIAEEMPWLPEPQIHTKLNSEQALTLLKDEKLLAIIPSILDNSPLMVTECLDREIPFVTTDIGGTPELIDLDATPYAISDPRPDAFAARIIEAFSQPIAPAKRQHQPTAIDQRWGEWHSNLVPQVAPTTSSTDEIADVVACVVHHERPAELAEALEGVTTGTVKPKQIVVVDNGSIGADADAYLSELEAAQQVNGVPVIIDRQPNLYPGAARNKAVAATESEFLLFMDDDNIGMPNMLETFIRAAQNNDAAAFTCFFDRFQDGTDRNDPSLLSRVLPAGDVGAIGYIENAFGDTNALVRRSAFVEVGGFHAVWGVGREDHSFFATLSGGGYGVCVVPEVLFWYRRSDSSISRRHFDKNAYAGPSIAAMHGAANQKGRDRLFMEFAAGQYHRVAGVQEANKRLKAAMRFVRSQMIESDTEIGALLGALARQAELDGYDSMAAQLRTLSESTFHDPSALGEAELLLEVGDADQGTEIVVPTEVVLDEAASAPTQANA